MWAKGPWSWALGVVLLLFVVISVGILTDDRTVGGVVIGVGILIPSAWGAVRALLSHVRLDDEGLVYVGYVRTHRLRWDQVSAFEVSSLDSSSPFESVGVVVHLHGGGKVGLASLAGVAISGRVERLGRLVREGEHRRGAST